MAKYETSTKDYLFAILISGTKEEKNGALRELCNRYKNSFEMTIQWESEVDFMEYRGFTIQENEMKCIYGDEKFTVTNFLVYKEDNGEKYFLPDVTAFDTVDEAKETIDEILGKEKFEIKYAVDIVDHNLGDSIQTLLVTENHDDAYKLCEEWNSEKATDTIYAEVFEIDREEAYNNDKVVNGYVKQK